MAKNLKMGDTVYVPWSRLGLADGGDGKPYAISTATVAKVENRTVHLNIPGEGERSVASSADEAGIAIIRIGDYQTETTLLDPLAKSVLQYCRLLVADDTVRLWELRTETELQQFWSINHSAYRHVILIAHGGPDGLMFGDQPLPADQLGQVFAVEGQSPKIFLSLSCQTGQAAFSRQFSKSPGCETLIAPFGSIHGAVASQFCQTFMGFHLIEGRTKVAFNRTRESVPSGARFRLWQKGKMQTPGAES